jgi:hypothetical protein
VAASNRVKEKLRRTVQGELQPGEEVLTDVIGRAVPDLVGDPLILALTNRRLIAHVKHKIGGSTLSWSYKNVTAVGTGDGLFKGRLVFSVPGSKFVAGSIPNAEAEAFRRAVEARLSLSTSDTAALPPPGFAPAPPPAEDSSVAHRLARLDGLLGQELISQDEYDKGRSTILDSI